MVQSIYPPGEDMNSSQQGSVMGNLARLSAGAILVLLEDFQGR
jgi:hypothetical protein